MAYNKLPAWDAKVKRTIKEPDTGRLLRVLKTRHFACEDCGCAPDAPQLEDEVWLTVATKSTLLCCTCLETRLRRPFAAEDLRQCPMNGAVLYVMGRTSL